MAFELTGTAAPHSVTTKAANKVTKDILAAGDAATAEAHAAAIQAHKEAQAAHLARAAELKAQGQKLKANPHIASAKKHSDFADKHIAHLQEAMKLYGGDLPATTPIGAHGKPHVVQPPKVAPTPPSSPAQQHDAAQQHAAATGADPGLGHKESAASAKSATKKAMDSNHAEHHEEAVKAHKAAAKAHLARAAALKAKGLKMQANPHIASAAVHEMHAKAHAQKHFLKGPKGGTYYLSSNGTKIYDTTIVPEKEAKPKKAPNVVQPTAATFAATAPASSGAPSAPKTPHTPLTPFQTQTQAASAWQSAGFAPQASGKLGKTSGKLPATTAPKEAKFFGNPEKQKNQHAHVLTPDSQGYMWHPSVGKWFPASTHPHGDPVYGQKGTHELPAHAYDPTKDSSHPSYKPTAGYPATPPATAKKSSVSSVTSVKSGMSPEAQAAQKKIGGYLPNWMYEVAAKYPGYKQLASESDLLNEMVKSGHEGYINKAPVEQRKAMKAFTNGDYHSMNDPFREGRPLTPTMKAQADHLDKLLENAPPLKEALVVHRGVGSGVGWPPSLLNNPQKLVGATFEAAGFNSTSATKPWSGTKFTILCPKGSRGVLHVGDKSSHPSEQETLLYRSAKMKIISAEKDPNGKLHVIAELLPYTPPPPAYTQKVAVTYTDFLKGVQP